MSRDKIVKKEVKPSVVGGSKTLKTLPEKAAPLFPTHPWITESMYVDTSIYKKGDPVLVEFLGKCRDVGLRYMGKSFDTNFNYKVFGVKKRAGGCYILCGRGNRSRGHTVEVSMDFLLNGSQGADVTVTPSDCIITRYDETITQAVDKIFTIVEDSLDYDYPVGREAGASVWSGISSKDIAGVIRRYSLVADEDVCDTDQLIVDINENICDNYTLEESGYDDGDVSIESEESVRLIIYKFLINLGNNAKTTKEGDTMTQANTTRRVVTVTLIDDDKGVPVDNSLVKKWPDVVTEDCNDTTIQELILNNNVKGVLDAHNEKRVTLDDLDILERTGNKVKLQPVKLKDLRWLVS